MRAKNEKIIILVMSDFKEIGSAKSVEDGGCFEFGETFMVCKLVDSRRLWRASLASLIRRSGFSAGILGFGSCEDNGCSLPKSCCFNCFNLFSSRVILAMLVIEPSTHEVCLSSTKLTITKKTLYSLKTNLCIRCGQSP